MGKPTRQLPLVPRRGWRRTSTMLTLVFPITITATPPIPLVGAMTMPSLTASSTVAFTPGPPRWTAQARGAQTAKVADSIKHACLCIRCVVLAPRVGISRQRMNSNLCLLRSADNLRRTRRSNRQVAGMVAATARMIIRSRRCLPAVVATVGLTAMLATPRTSGVLQ